MSTNLPAWTCCTSLAGTGRVDIERLRSPDAPGKHQSKPPDCPSSCGGTVCITGVDTLQATGGSTPVADVLEIWIEERDAGGGRDPKGVVPAGRRRGPYRSRSGLSLDTNK